MVNIVLTEKQEEGIKLAKKWWHGDERNKRPFIIQGIAGAGKSTLVSSIIEGLGLSLEQVRYCSFTGTSALNLSKKGNPASTIHRLIYHPFVNKQTHKVSFTLKDPDDFPSISLIVIDEVGMINEKLYNDLASFGVPILALGDKEQLKQFSGQGLDLLDHPDVVLNEPMRQSLDSPILALAYKVLRGEKISPRDSSENGLIIVPKNQIPDEYLTSADQIIVGRNKTVQELTDRIRHQIFGLEGPYPYANEKLMCLKNDWDNFITTNNFEQYLTNGLTGFADNFSSFNKGLKTFKMNFSPLLGSTEADTKFKSIIADGLYFSDGIRKEDDFYTKENKEKYHKIMFKRKVEEDTNFTKIGKFYYGYAETAYKAQGSEFDNVLYVDDLWGGKDMVRRQRYVAITRAKKNLVVAI